MLEPLKEGQCDRRVVCKGREVLGKVGEMAEALPDGGRICIKETLVACSFQHLHQQFRIYFHRLFTICCHLEIKKGQSVKRSINLADKIRIQQVQRAGA